MKRRIQCVLIEWFQVGFLSIQSLLFLFAIFCHFVAKNINFSCGWLCCYYRGTELWQTFCHNQGSKLRLIRSPMRLTFSPWRLKILVYSPKWRPDFRRVKLKKKHFILSCFAFIMKNVPNRINKASLPPNLYRFHDIFKSDESRDF